MNRDIFKTVVWYSPNKADMKICGECSRGWAFYCSDLSGLYVHKPHDSARAIICRSVNKEIPKYLSSRVAEAA